MRPIRMKIKGLNSFLEAQEIDFEQLTGHGLFGIFGPTGSGKSSILDGITLALYGTTARNSANYINVNTDRASVDYIFSVKEKTERFYRVSRSFRRSKEGAIRSDGAKFMEITGDEPRILADKVNAVNEKCREVIGLSKEDFFRTVVLPQGKFSEFLKLEGMERNKMLERLFHLERYGDKLVALIKEQENRWDGEKREKEGALARYQDTSEEKTDSLRLRKAETATLLTQKGEKLEAARAQYAYAEKLFHYQREYKRLAEEIEKQEVQRAEFQILEAELEKAEKANILKIYLQDAKKAERHAKETLLKKETALKNWKEKQERAEQAGKEKAEAEDKVQKEIPVLELQKARLDDACSFLQEKKKTEEEFAALETETAELLAQLEEGQQRFKLLDEALLKTQTKKEVLQQEINEVTLSAKMQNIVVEGYQLYQSVLETEKKETETLKQKEMWTSKAKRLQTEAEELSAEEVRLLENYQKLEEECSVLKEKKENLYVQNLSAVLAANLKEGEPCPVCGNSHPVFLRKDAGKVEGELSHIKLLLEKNEHARRVLQEDIQKKRTQKAKNEAEREHFFLRLKEAEKETEKVNKELKEKRNLLIPMQTKYEISDFAVSYQTMKEHNRIREEKQEVLHRIESDMDVQNEKKENLNRLIQEQRAKLAEKETLLQQLAKNIKKLDEQILEKAGAWKNPDAGRQTVTARIEQIRQNYRQTALLWESIEKEENQLRRDYTAQEAFAESAERESAQKSKLRRDKMQEYQIEDEAWIETFQKEPSVIKETREKIEGFKADCVRLKTQLEQLEEHLQEPAVSEEELNLLGGAVKTLEDEIAEQNKTFGALKKELEEQEKALLEKTALEKELKNIYHKQDILEELNSLFRGKKFVEYVSRYYLEYVSREADAQLKEMTGGSYGLETDGNGLFVIRDYKNGGISRPASTLSGGETFLASLSLALALSSQIQMKGAAPLELFFLDEGFGTLDENYLEVVMESLEKIRNRKRSVGVISHVEEIKARIPVKLLVEPAKAGEGGSRIRIENAI